MLGKLMNTYHIYTACVSPALNGSSVLEHFERSNAIKICNGIMFDFYLAVFSPEFARTLLPRTATYVKYVHVL